MSIFGGLTGKAEKALRERNRRVDQAVREAQGKSKKKKKKGD